MKHAIVTTISGGYMFALNANFNTNKFYGTNADFHILYHYAMEKEYMEACTEAFKDSFNIKWMPMDDWGSFHSAKYSYGKSLAGQYDSICLIDADLFIITNLDECFKKAATENIMMTGQHLWSGGIKDNLFMLDWENVIDRCNAQLADFPVFINPANRPQLFQDWYDWNEEGDKECNHPLVAFNRSIRKNFKSDEVLDLDGHFWIADMEFWKIKYTWNRETNIMYNDQDQRMCAIHNKWWKLGRANGEWLGNRINDGQPDFEGRLDKGEHNFNEIKDMMAFFNEMTPATKREDYMQERIDRRAYLAAHKD